MPKGKLIEIEGSDGVGKATQARLLVKRLKAKKIPYQLFSFPIYSSKYGKLITKCLRGKLGDIKDIDPYYFANLYAEDRKAVRDKIQKALDQGKIVVIDRYVASNLYHVPKFKTKKEQKKFLKWLYNLEYKKNKLPKENILIYLYAPLKIVKKQLTKRNGKSKLDLNERNIEFLNAVQKVFLKEISLSLRWKKLNCTKDNKMLSRKEISDNLYKIIKNII